MPAEVETMMSVREVPWHKLGTVIDDHVGIPEAMELGGIGWTVRADPVYDKHGILIPGHSVNVRESDGANLGIVGRGHRIVQNAEMGAFAEALVDGGLKPETLGALKGGRLVWMLFKWPEDLLVDDDPHERYLFCANSHDMSVAFTAADTPVRVVCHNTWTMALNAAPRTFKVKHTASVHGRIHEARQALGMMQRYDKAFEDEVKKLLALPASTNDFSHILDHVIPLPDDEGRSQTIAIRKRDLAIGTWGSEPTKGTAWGVVNAFNAVDLWDTGVSEPERAARRIVFSEQPYTRAALAAVRN